MQRHSFWSVAHHCQSYIKIIAPRVEADGNLCVFLLTFLSLESNSLCQVRTHPHAPRCFQPLAL